MADETLKAAVDVALAAAVDQPASFSVDGQSTTFRSTRDLIDLDNHVSKRRGHRFGFGIARMNPPEH
jgi:hypothetical protein